MTTNEAQTYTNKLNIYLYISDYNNHTDKTTYMNMMKDDNNM